MDCRNVPFAGAEAYYAEHRPDYAPEAIDYLVERFDVDADVDARVLDLGCGTGQLAVPLAAHAGTVVCVDPNPEMLDQTRARADSAGRTNVELVEGAESDLGRLGPELAPIRLATMGRSFHWMNQTRTLDHLRGMLEPNGGVAIVTGEELLTRCESDWAGAVYDLVDDYIDDVPDRNPGPVEYDDPWDELLKERGFVDVETRTYDQRIEWGADRIVGYVFSLSFAPRSAFGDRADEFERDLRQVVAGFDGESFGQQSSTDVICGRTP